MGIWRRSFGILRGVAMVLMAGVLPAQVMLVEPAGPLLPQRFGAWQMQDTASTGTDAAQIDPVHGAELTEDGLRRFAVAKYVRGTATLDVQATQFIDATGASAAISLYRATRTGLQVVPAGQALGAETAAGNGEVLFREGNAVVSVKGVGVQAGELRALAATLPKISGPRGMSPLLPTLLPGRGLQPESVRYTLGPVSYKATGGVLPPKIVGFDKSAEEVTANYTRPGKGTLTLLLYPTPQIAGDHGREIEAWVNANKGGLGTVKLRREGPMVLMTTGDFPPEEAQRMIENIHLKSEVTWDKKLPQEFHTEIRKTASLLVSIAVLSGVLMLAAVLLGLFLGVGRASIRVLLGKPAAAEVEFLGLGLTRGLSKPIQTQDGPLQG